MKKVRLYTFTFLVICATVLLASFFAFRYLYGAARERLWNSKMESSQRESREIARLLEAQLKSGLTPQQVIDNLQQSILNTDPQSEFICMYNQAGIELCHPNPALVGQKIEANNSHFFVPPANKTTSFNEVLQSGKTAGGIRRFPEEKHRSSEIVNVFPVKGTDWMVAAHANVAVLEEQLADLYRQYSIGFLVMALAIVAGCYLFIRMLYYTFEQNIEAEIDRLNEKVNSLGTLNQQLNHSQEKLQQQLLVSGATTTEEKKRKRIVTYQKDEMLSLEVDDISFFYLHEDTILIKSFTGNTFTTNTSLDELMKQLDNRIFYRANRQYIININAIRNIFLYGKNQLKLIIKPEAAEDIIISKNKVAEFKKWLDQ